MPSPKPPAAFIRTVLGDVPAEQVGIFYAHEHIVIDESFTTHEYPEFLLDQVDRIAAELVELYAAGCRAMLDTMPAACGRNVVKSAEVSRRSGVHIVCPTGLHLQKYYPPGHWSTRMAEAELTRLFVDEITSGIDGNDLNGPEIRRTAHRAGVIKVAGGRDRLSDHERKLFRAAAAAQRASGAPIITHTEQGTAGLEQIAVLRDAGADLEHVVLSHCDRLADVNYHRQLLATGVTLEYDSAFRWKPEQGNPTLDLLLALLPEFPDQLVLGMDAARSRYWRSYGGEPGLTFLLRTFVPTLKSAGVSDDHIHRVFVTTPARVYSMSAAQLDN